MRIVYVDLLALFFLCYNWVVFGYKLKVSVFMQDSGSGLDGCRRNQAIYDASNS